MLFACIDKVCLSSFNFILDEILSVQSVQALVIYLVFYIMPSTLSVILWWVVGKAEKPVYTGDQGAVL